MSVVRAKRTQIMWEKPPPNPTTFAHVCIIVISKKGGWCYCFLLQEVVGWANGPPGWAPPSFFMCKWKWSGVLKAIL